MVAAVVTGLVCSTIAAAETWCSPAPDLTVPDVGCCLQAECDSQHSCRAFSMHSLRGAFMVAVVGCSTTAAAETWCSPAPDLTMPDVGCCLHAGQASQL